MVHIKSERIKVKKIGNYNLPKLKLIAFLDENQGKNYLSICDAKSGIAQNTFYFINKSENYILLEKKNENPCPQIKDVFYTPKMAEHMMSVYALKRLKQKKATTIAYEVIDGDKKISENHKVNCLERLIIDKNEDLTGKRELPYVE